MNDLQEFQEKYSQSFLHDLNNSISILFGEEIGELNEIFRYHLGLDDSLKKQGKRVRPLLTLLCTEGCGGDWKTALPAAVAIELIHNFSLIHDDIEDNGLTRRSKDAVWIKWGLPKGLNAGDAMFASAFKILNGLREKIPAERVIDAVELLSSACLKLTAGQLLDIDFEKHEDISNPQYFEMVSGKTAALLSCCTQMGALIAGLDLENQLLYSRFGTELGMAFQIYDDWLGIWGDPKITGKSASSDLMEGKKSLPVIIGLANSKRFYTRWKGKPISKEEVAQISKWLSEDGVEESVMKEFKLWNQKALDNLDSLKCDIKVKSALKELAIKLLMRSK